MLKNNPGLSGWKSSCGPWGFGKKPSDVLGTKQRGFCSAMGLDEEKMSKSRSGGMRNGRFVFFFACGRWGYISYIVDLKISLRYLGSIEASTKL